MVNGLHLYSAFIQSALQRPLIHPFTHTFTHQWRQATMQGAGRPAHWEQFGVQCLAQGHFDMWPAGARTADLPTLRSLDGGSTSCATAAPWMLGYPCSTVSASTIFPPIFFVFGQKKKVSPFWTMTSLHPWRCINNQITISSSTIFR